MIYVNNMSYIKNMSYINNMSYCVSFMSYMSYVSHMNINIFMSCLKSLESAWNHLFFVFKKCGIFMLKKLNYTEKLNYKNKILGENT